MKLKKIKFAQAMECRENGVEVYMFGSPSVPYAWSGKMSDYGDGPYCSHSDFYIKEKDPKEEQDEQLGEIVKTGWVRFKTSEDPLGSFFVSHIYWGADDDGDGYFMHVGGTGYTKEETINDFESTPSPLIPPHKRVKQ